MEEIVEEAVCSVITCIFIGWCVMQIISDWFNKTNEKEEKINTTD